MSRRKAREEFFKMMFESDVKGEMPVDIYKGFLARHVEEIDSDEIIFIENHAKGISENYDKINQIIEENMDGWKMDRIGTVERALLRIATYEIIKKDGEIGYKISVNEAVELAKIYGEERSYEFINGVLAGIIKNNVGDNK